MWAATVKDETHSKRVLQVAAGGGLLLLAAGHGLRFQMDAMAGAALGVNVAAVATAIILLWLGMAGSRVAGRSAAAAARTAGS